MSSLTDGGLLVASNRLPITLEQRPDGTWISEPGSGGLVTALRPVLAAEGGVWVGWPGVLEEEVDDLAALVRDTCTSEPYRVEPVALTREERSDFYLGFSNEILWPLCHGFPGRCRFEPRYWRVYRRVNQKFAESILAASSDSRLVWVHDYHLMAVAEYLRAEGFHTRCGYFHHIPFPPLDIFGHLPWADEVLRSLLDYDLLGFQTSRDRQNFFDCLTLLGEDVTVQGDDSAVGPSGRRTRVGVFPISVDWKVFHGGALQETVAHRARRFREEFDGNRIFIGVDRLDYTKGIPERLAGMERALERFPDLRERITLVQLVVPSRESIPEYERMKSEIEQMVGRINGRFTRGAWVPVVYRFDSLERRDLLALYRAADVALVTPLNDGMNLVSKEFVAASVDGRGVLVLSSFAGAAEELSMGAIEVNPNDIEALAEAIHQAATMPADEQRARLQRMQDRVREFDVHAWVRAYLAAAENGEAAEAEPDPDRVPVAPQ